MSWPRRRFNHLAAVLGAAPLWSPMRALAGAPPPALPPREPARLPHAECFELDSRHTGQRYRIWLGLPAGAAPASGYPALLALDGQAAFALMEPARLRPQPTHALRQAKAGAQRPGLVVGIGYASLDPIDVDARALDYTPAADCQPCDASSPRHGGAARFLDFIDDELLPVLARMFPLDRGALTLFGHSYGGLFTLYTLLHRPALFARYWAASPSLWFGAGLLMQDLDARLQRLDKPAGERRVHLAVGLLEQPPDPQGRPERSARLAAHRMLPRAREFAAVLGAAAARDWPGLAVSLDEVAGHDHGAMLMHGAAAVPGFAFG